MYLCVFVLCGCLFFLTSHFTCWWIDFVFFFFFFFAGAILDGELATSILVDQNDALLDNADESDDAR